MLRIAIFPGSFDPITKGHEDIVLRSLKLFDKVIVGVGNNSEKKYLFTVEKRVNWIKLVFENHKNVEAIPYSGLTVDFCKRTGANFMIRGLRSQNDFEFEKNIAQMNKAMVPDIETVFLICKPDFTAITSTIVRDIIRNNGEVSRFVPEKVKC